MFLFLVSWEWVKKEKTKKKKKRHKKYKKYKQTKKHIMKETQKKIINIAYFKKGTSRITAATFYSQNFV